jgi:hypothetical protein
LNPHPGPPPLGEGVFGEIAAASREQAMGIEQVNKAVTEMDRAIQHNAAIAEESASSAEQMKDRAAEMQNFVEALVALIGKGVKQTGIEPTDDENNVQMATQLAYKSLSQILDDRPFLGRIDDPVRFDGK